MNNDPTYNQTKIEENPVWYLAWVISEIQNDNAPLGWGKYIPLAESLSNSFIWERKK